MAISYKEAIQQWLAERQEMGLCYATVHGIHTR
jgi:regulator of sigma D